MFKKIVDDFFEDEGFDEVICRRCKNAKDDEEIEKLLENDDEKIDIFKVKVHPVHLLDDLKELYARNEIQWYDNRHGNVLARGETCLGTEYVFYVNWEQAAIVRYYCGSRKTFTRLKTGQIFMLSYL